MAVCRRKGCAGCRGRASTGCDFGLLFQMLLPWLFAAGVASTLGAFFLKETPYTAFYEFPRARLEMEQSDRHAAALRFFSETRVDAEPRVELLLDGTPRRDPRYVDTCIAVLRDDREYFLPTMHSLLSAMRADERDNVHIVVVDTSAARSKANVTVHDLDFVRPFNGVASSSFTSIVRENFPMFIFSAFCFDGNDNGLRSYGTCGAINKVRIGDRRRIHRNFVSAMAQGNNDIIN